MNKHLRAWATVAVAIVVGVVAPGVAHAVSPAAVTPTASASATATPSDDPSYGCLGDTDGYGNDLPCELTVEYATPVCDGDVPKLQYKVTAVGTPNTTVTLTWAGNGQTYQQAGLPLEGIVLWPGAVVDESGNAVDWPGWTQLPDGTWVEGDEFDWVRPSVDVTFQVNPQATVHVAYPPSSPKCAAPPGEEVLPVPPDEEPPGEDVLAATGSTVGPLAAVGGGALVLGALTVGLVAWLRRRHADA